MPPVFPHLQPISHDAVGDIAAPLIASFDFALSAGLRAVERHLHQEVHVEREGKPTVKLRFWLSDLQVGEPTVEYKHANGNDGVLPLLPRECRERRLNYHAPLSAQLWRQLDKREASCVDVHLGYVPIMVRSAKCHLHGLPAESLMRAGEDPSEMGGYFISNGNEKIIRYLIASRRNYPAALERPAFAKKGENFSSKAVVFRSVRDDETSATLTLHYLNTGTCMAKIKILQNEYFIPLGLLLKCLRPEPFVTDFELFSRVTRGASHNSFAAERIELELRAAGGKSRFTYGQCVNFLGAQFRDRIPNLPADASHLEAGKAIIDRYVLVHLGDAGDAKLDCVVEMTRKLYAFVQGAVGADNPDALSAQEVLLPGHIYLQILRESLENALHVTRKSYEVELGKAARTATAMAVADKVAQTLEADVKSADLKKRLVKASGDVGKKLFYFLATGNLVSTSGLDLMQTGGFTVLAEKLNRLRYLSHFVAVHRGAFFASMKTTTGRKLLPDSWGFLCPVHTPDGAPCGLLNHLVVAACPVGGNVPADVAKLALMLTRWGMNPSSSAASALGDGEEMPVWADGRLLGHASPATCADMARRLRLVKVNALAAVLAGMDNGGGWHDGGQVFPTARVLAALDEPRADAVDAAGAVCAALEVALVPMGDSKVSPSPGLFLFSGRGRLLRPVLHVGTGLVELIGPLEQAFLSVAVRPEELEPHHTHVEIRPASAMLSLVAALTPFSDFNQSPRNMYQCQMGKQTMGTAMYNYERRADNKTYRICTPQAPLVQTQAQAAFAVDEYPSGTNAIVAVISYTGYDMDDAMIVNKSSMERGFAHATVYKTHVLQVEGPAEVIANPDGQHKGLDSDGLPALGAKLREGDAMASFLNTTTGKARLVKHKDGEDCTVCRVSVSQLAVPVATRTRGYPDAKAGGVRQASVTTRYNRNPVVGDKFSSRHGQKGVLSVLWPHENMPFTESGMTPDVIINPHAFPSRMTIGMLVEIMAGKVAALYGEPQDATPFTKQGDEQGATAVDYFGAQLAQAGYAYHGSEPMYSGVDGREMRADIFFGPCYYQRLRHMVSDKSQVRSTGPVDAMTRQPIKGRKRHGGIRFGEMERDSLVAHGAAFLAQDRLLNCSDKHTAYVCCGSLLSAHVVPGGKDDWAVGGTRVTCRLCGKDDAWRLVTVPYVLRYLGNELAAMGVKMQFEF